MRCHITLEQIQQEQKRLDSETAYTFEIKIVREREMEIEIDQSWQIFSNV